MQFLGEIDPDEVSPVRGGAQRRRFAFAKSAETGLDPALMDVLEVPHAHEGALVDELRKSDAEEAAQMAAVAVVRLMKGFELDNDLIVKAMSQGDEPAEEAEPEETEDDATDLPSGDRRVSKTADDELGAPEQKEQQMSETAAPAVPILKADGSWDLSGVPDEAKGFYESVLKAADTAKAENEELREEIKKANASADEANATLREREFVAKADSEFGKIAPATELGAVLKEAHEKLDPETVEKLETILKGANERVEQGDLFAEVGNKVMKGNDVRTAAGVRDASSGDAWTKIEKLAEGLVEKSDDNLSQEQAIARVLKTAEGRELYQSYMSDYYGGVA